MWQTETLARCWEGMKEKERWKQRERDATSALINLSRKSRRVMWPGHGKSTSLKKSICQVSRRVQRNKDGVEKVKEKKEELFLDFL
jgi:hypothetical protein